MSFVNEPIPDADKHKYDAFNFVSPFNREPVPAWKWTIDRKRDVFLVGLGGQGGEGSEIPAFFALVFEGHPVHFRSFTNGKGDYQSGIELWSHIFRISLPKEIESRKDEVLATLQEAVDAWGTGYKREHVIAIHIQIDEQSFVMEVE